MAEDFTTLFRVNQPHFPHQLSRPIGPEPFQCMAGIAGIEPANAGVMVPDNRFALLFDNLSYLDESDKSRALPLGYIPLIITYIQLCHT